MLDGYLNGPLSVADRLLSPTGGMAAAVKAARKRAAKDMLAEWQRAWDALSREKAQRQVATVKYYHWPPANIFGQDVSWPYHQTGAISHLHGGGGGIEKLDPHQRA